MSVVPKLEIGMYVDVAWRRKWWIVISFLFSIVAAVAYLKVAPKSYRTSTLILVEPQSIPDSYVRTTVTESVEARLRTITQQVHSRTNLEKIISEFDLGKASTSIRQDLINLLENYLPALAEKISPKHEADERLALVNLIEDLRDKLTVALRGGANPSASGNQNVAFEITFEWHNPEVMAAVTNAVASSFIEQNLSVREEKAVATTDFLEREEADYRQLLEAREQELEAFKRQNMGMLPDQLEANVRILNQLTEERNNLERRLDQEKQQAIVLRSEAQIAQMNRLSSLPASVDRPPQRMMTNSGRDQQVTNEQLTGGDLESLETELQRLSLHYTNKHPDIIALKKRIEDLKKAPAATTSSTSPRTAPSAAQNTTAMQLAQVNARIEGYRRDIQEVERQIGEYKNRVERTPQVEMQLQKITRDYQTVRLRYDGILQKKLDAKMAEELERKQKGEKFRVIDPAVRPAKPFKPNPLKIIMAALVIGLGMGGGLAYLRETLDPCFYNPKELEDFIKTSVIVSLPNADIKSKS